jgi:hypothetical protein
LYTIIALGIAAVIAMNADSHRLSLAKTTTPKNNGRSRVWRPAAQQPREVAGPNPLPHRRARRVEW